MVKIIANIIILTLLITSCIEYCPDSRDPEINYPQDKNPGSNFKEIRAIAYKDNNVYFLIQKFNGTKDSIVKRCLVQYNLSNNNFIIHYSFNDSTSKIFEVFTQYTNNRYYLKSGINSMIFIDNNLHIIGFDYDYKIVNKDIYKFKNNNNFLIFSSENIPYNVIKKTQFNQFKLVKGYYSQSLSDLKTFRYFPSFDLDNLESRYQLSNGFKIVFSRLSFIQPIENKEYLISMGRGTDNGIYKFIDTTPQKNIFSYNGKIEGWDIATNNYKDYYLYLSDGKIYKYGNDTMKFKFSFQRKDLQLTNLLITKNDKFIGFYNTGSRVYNRTNLDEESKEIISIYNNGVEDVYEFKTKDYFHYNFYTDDVESGVSKRVSTFLSPIPTAEDENGNVFIGGQAFRIYNGSTLKSFPLDSIIKVLGLGW